MKQCIVIVDKSRQQLGKINDIARQIHAMVRKMEEQRRHVRETLVVLDRDHPRFDEANVTLSWNPVKPQVVSTKICTPVENGMGADISPETFIKRLQSENEALRRECNEKAQMLDEAISESNESREKLTLELTMMKERHAKAKSEKEELHRKDREISDNLNKAISEARVCSERLSQELTVARERYTKA